MALPESALPYWRQQQQITASAVAVVLRAWQTSGGNRTRWEALIPLLVAKVSRAQAAAILLAAEYVESVLDDLSVSVTPMAVIDATPLVGLAGNGLPLAGLYAGLPDELALNAARIADEPSLASAAVNTLAPSLFRAAMIATTRQLSASVQTTMSDTGRAAESLEIAVRPGIGYIRMLNPPSCKRCVILAGKWYRWNAGFQRHPRCDCRHIPAPESDSVDLRVDPMRYFNSLDTAEQDKAFGKAGAQAVRDGADLNQVVNASRGMRTAQVYGQDLNITSEGVTKRGVAGKAIRARGRDPKTTPRLMPSSIYEIADDRQDAVRLLRLNGYVAEPVVKARTPGVPRPSSSRPSAQPPRRPATGSTGSGPPPAPPRGGNAVASSSDDDRDSYRLLDHRTRRADPRHAEPLADIVNARDADGVPDEARARQLADDLSGKYGPYAVEFNEVAHTGGRVVMNGLLWADDGRSAGVIAREFYRDPDGELVVVNGALLLQPWAQKRGFSTELSDTLDTYYRRSGVDRIMVHAADELGGYAWAKREFEWDPRPRKIEESLNNVRSSATALANAASTSPSARIVLNEVLSRLSPAHPDLPTPLELAELSTADTPSLGRTLMTGTKWDGVKFMKGGR